MNVTLAKCVLLWTLLVCSGAYAVDFSFSPNLIYGALGDTITLSGTMGPSDTLRSFTIYIYNDTNQVDLVPPVDVGSLLAGRTGLQFDYFDHPPNAPHRLEIGAAVFGTEFWAGPGELFQLRFRLLDCADIAPPADVGFREPDGTFVPGVYNPPLILACERVPQPPMNLTILSQPVGYVALRWEAVRFDTLGFPLHGTINYAVYRQQIQPVILPPVLIDAVTDTILLDGTLAADQFEYYIITQLTP